MTHKAVPYEMTTCPQCGEDYCEHCESSCPNLHHSCVAENTRLQERVEEAERLLIAAKRREKTHTKDRYDAQCERDRYKARAERRKEALERIESMTVDYVGTSQAAGDIAKVARAALAQGKKA